MRADVGAHRRLCSSSGTVIAPVMIATASCIECVFGADHRRPAAEALDVDPVGGLEDVGHVVADQDDAEALVAQVADQAQHLRRLAYAERGGRLVEDGDLAAERAGAGHRDDLALATRTASRPTG